MRPATRVGQRRASRGGHKARTLQANLKAASRERRRPCILCGQPIDYDLPAGQPGSFSVEHIKSWVDHPELRYEPSNLAPAHLLCNESKGNHAASPGLGLPRGRW